MNQQTSAQQQSEMDSIQVSLSQGEPELTEQQEEKYMLFCEKHDLDVMVDAYEQLDTLQTLGNKELATILRGILVPHTSTVTKKKNLCVSVMEAIIADEVAQAAHDAQVAAKSQAPEPIRVRSNTEPAPRIALWCAHLPLESVKNSSRTKSGQIQLGLAL